MADTPNSPTGDHSHGHGHGNDPMAQLWMAMSGASAGHHEEVPGADQKSVSVGHEPDQFDARTIIYVPVVVAIMLVVTYLLVQGAFLFVNGRESQQLAELTTDSTDPAEIERVRKENLTRVKEWNDRTTRIRNWTAEPVEKSTPGEQTLPPVPQPQLEYSRQLNLERKDAYGNTVKDPPFLRSFAPTGKNNSPEIYPEDLRPANFRDPWLGGKLLEEASWVKGQEGKLAIVPIEEMIHLVTHDSKWKDTLKVAKEPAKALPGTLGKPKFSAGGVTGPAPAAVEKKDEHKH
ncbi:MAG: hypothetical protein MUF18_00120 [Fimbriiglobus sp.]|jgi:hypothetical protein|nr:hypothetical protein [Fimbriiglobus sp.]